MPPRIERLRADIEHLALIERPSASDGERRAAEWIRERLADAGADARIEVERAHGTYWIPLGLLTGAGAVAGLLAGARPRRRRAAAAVAALATAGIADDVTAGPHVLRRLLPHRATYNVVAEAGDPAAGRTLVFLAHHDAARGGLIFSPRLLTWIADRFPEAYDRQTTGARPMLLVAAGPALVALGALTGATAVRRAGLAVSLASVAAFADIGARGVVPGANDNLSAVGVVLELARLLAERPVSGVRVLLVSTGSEESFMEGMRGFLRRHAGALARDATELVCLESVGSPELVLVEGEGMLRIHDYPAETRDRVERAAAEAGVGLRRGLRLGLATDGRIALRHGYRCATIASVTRYKFPGHYHSQQDVPRNLAWRTIADATRVCEQLIRSAAA